jgi:hypothetical protein
MQCRHYSIFVLLYLSSLVYDSISSILYCLYTREIQNTSWAPKLPPPYTYFEFPFDPYYQWRNGRQVKPAWVGVSFVIYTSPLIYIVYRLPFVFPISAKNLSQYSRPIISHLPDHRTGISRPYLAGLPPHLPEATDSLVRSTRSASPTPPCTASDLLHRLLRPQHQIRFTNAAVHCTIWVHRLPRLPYLIRFTNDAVHCTGSASPTPSFQICFPEPIIDRPRSASSTPTPTATAAPPPSSTWPARMPSMTTRSRRRGNQTPSPLHVLVCYHRRFKHVLVN